MIEHVLWYFRKAKFYLLREGLFRFIKRSLSFLKSKVFLYESHYIFQKSLDNVIESEHFAPKIENYDFKIISTMEEMHDQLGKGFNINSPFSISTFCKRLNQGQIAFCIFVKKDLAHWSWVAMNRRVLKKVKGHPPLNVNSEQEACVWGSNTPPRYGGLGLYTYSLSRVYEYLKEIGKSRAIFTVLKDNEPVIRAQTKLGAKVCGEGNYLRLFGRTFWKEKSIKNPS